MRLSTWIGCRPILGLLVRKHYLPPEQPRDHWYVIKHVSVNLYLRDPYSIRPNAGDPRSDWGLITQAWRYGTERKAQESIDYEGWTGQIIRVESDRFRRTSRHRE